MTLKDNTGANPVIISAPWPMRVIRVIILTQFSLFFLACMILLSSFLEIDPKNGLSCDEADSAFSQMRHGVFCGYLRFHYSGYLQVDESREYEQAGTHMRVIPLQHRTGLLNQIAMDLLLSDLLYLILILLAVTYRSMWLYIAISLVIAFYGTTHRAISYSVISILALLALLHKPTRAWLLCSEYKNNE